MAIEYQNHGEGVESATHKKGERFSWTVYLDQDLYREGTASTVDAAREARRGVANELLYGDEEE